MDIINLEILKTLTSNQEKDWYIKKCIMAYHEESRKMSTKGFGGRKINTILLEKYPQDNPNNPTIPSKNSIHN